MDTHSLMLCIKQGCDWSTSQEGGGGGGGGGQGGRWARKKTEENPKTLSQKMSFLSISDQIHNILFLEKWSQRAEFL